jgi:hypothetical protein
MDVDIILRSYTVYRMSLNDIIRELTIDQNVHCTFVQQKQENKN